MRKLFILFMFACLLSFIVAACGPTTDDESSDEPINADSFCRRFAAVLMSCEECNGYTTEDECRTRCEAAWWNDYEEAAQADIECYLSCLEPANCEGFNGADSCERQCFR